MLEARQRLIFVRRTARVDPPDASDALAAGGVNAQRCAALLAEIREGA